MIVKDRLGRKINTGMMQCDFCRKAISIKGIQIKEFWEGEYQIQYFGCPHCGHKFLSGVTDSQQRVLLQRRKSATLKIRTALEKHFKKNAVERLQAEMLAISDELKSRNIELAKIGNQMLWERHSCRPQQKEGADNGTV